MNQRPHKSTTHEEEFYHVDNKGTVFFRKEDDGLWYYNLSMCHYKDQFCRATGRSIARRKYFHEKIATHRLPSYEQAEDLFYDHYTQYN